MKNKLKNDIDISCITGIILELEKLKVGNSVSELQLVLDKLILYKDNLFYLGTREGYITSRNFRDENFSLIREYVDSLMLEGEKYEINDAGDKIFYYT
jgi:hypothetical protein